MVENEPSVSPKIGMMEYLLVRLSWGRVVAIWCVYNPSFSMCQGEPAISRPIVDSPF